MKNSFLLTTTLLSLTAASQAAIIWSDDYSSGRSADTIDPNPYSYSGASGNDYAVTAASNTFTVDGGVFNISDTTTASTTYISVASNRFSTTTFNSGDQITVSVDIRVNSLTSANGNSVPRFSIYTGGGANGAESVTVGFGYGAFTGQPSNTMGFYKTGASAGAVVAGGGIGVGSAGFNFGAYNSGNAALNGTSNGLVANDPGNANAWYRVTITMTQGEQAYTGSVTNLTTSDVAAFNGDLVNALDWGNNTSGGIRLITGQGGTSNFDIDNMNVNLTAVPEPSSVALLGGIGALTLLRRRRA